MKKRRKGVQCISLGKEQERRGFRIRGGKISGNISHGHNKNMRHLQGAGGEVRHHEDCPCGVIEKDCGGHYEHS